MRHREPLPGAAAARRPSSATRLAVTTLVGAAGGGAAWAVGLPGGVLVGTIIAVAALAVSRFPVLAPRRMRHVAQILVGTGIGATFTQDSLLVLSRLLAPVLLGILLLFVGGLLLGLWLSVVTPLDRVTALAATMPGGMLEMTILAGQLGGQAGMVVSLHVARVFVVLLSVPVVVWILNG